MPDDIAILNRVTEGQEKDGRASDMLIATEAREDTLRVEVIVPPSTPRPPPSRPNYTTGSQSRKIRKRRRLQGKGEGRTKGEGEEQGEDGWVKVGERSMVERVRNHMIRKAVNDVEDTDSGSDCLNTPAEELDDRFTPPSAQLPQAQAVNTASAYHPRQRPTCDGPAIALMFRKFVELFDEMPSLDNDEGSKQRYCDICRPLVTRRSALLHSELEK
jgi:hypothetical protein